jgi:hypothetical protein
MEPPDGDLAIRLEDTRAKAGLPAAGLRPAALISARFIFETERERARFAQRNQLEGRRKENPVSQFCCGAAINPLGNASLILRIGGSSQQRRLCLWV